MKKTKKYLMFVVLTTTLMLTTTSLARPIQEKTSTDSIEEIKKDFLESLEILDKKLQRNSALSLLISKILKKIETVRIDELLKSRVNLEEMQDIRENIKDITMTGLTTKRDEEQVCLTGQNNPSEITDNIAGKKHSTIMDRTRLPEILRGTLFILLIPVCTILWPVGFLSYTYSALLLLLDGQTNLALLFFIMGCLFPITGPLIILLKSKN